MKKLLTTIILILIINTSVYAISTKDTLSAIENSIFGYDYKKESDIVRIERLEEHMYGQKKSGTVQARVEALQNDTGITVVERKSSQEKVQSANNGSGQKSVQNGVNSNLKEDDTVEYAIVDKMEQAIFNQTYKNENIYDRLNRLETKVFQKTSNEDLSSRVDKLANILSPSRNKRMAEETTIIPDNFNNNFTQVNEQTLPFHLAALENIVLRHEYMGDNNASRLSRLEEKLFNRTFQTDNDVQRLQRILVAYEAKKDSYKYENNKRMQNIATMSQIGGILLMILAILL